jgi:hypothetical protein
MSEKEEVNFCTIVLSCHDFCKCYWLILIEIMLGKVVDDVVVVVVVVDDVVHTEWSGFY